MSTRTDPDEALAVLAADTSTLTQLLRAIETLEQQPQERTVRVGVSASATVDLLGVYLRRHGLLAGTGVEIVPGNFDDPIGDVERFRAAGVRHVVLLPFFDGLLPSFEAQLPNLEPGAVDVLEESLRSRYRLAFEAAREMDSVFVGSFHRLGSPVDLGGRDVVATVLHRFDAALREEAAGFSNTRVVDTQDVVSTVGRRAAFDHRFHLRSRAPYTGAFLDELARRITAGARGFGAHFHKVLVLDCDNTLWGGVVGEDSPTGVGLSPHDHPGSVYWRVQHQIAALRHEGVLLALCTKNNPDDVDEVLDRHPDMVLRAEDFVATRINWDDKPANLRALATELGVGLDSMVFLDDSPFECEAVRQQLPMVTTVQVPRTLSEYPRVVHRVAELFLAGGTTTDSRDKTEQYRRRAQAQQLQARSVDQETYLASLQLTVELRRDLPGDAARVSELSQKSNQFNLTTRRYSTAEVERLVASPEHAVYSLVVGDTFGSAGLTGAAVLRYDGDRAYVEAFFLSCRVIGRGVETSVWPQIVVDAIERGCHELHADFVPSAKNTQVADFYDRLGLHVATEADDGSRSYRIDAHDFHTPPPAWIEMSSLG
ncbi:HAD-IIIC family phosphatase [Modestobacter sp. VKM Ac-2985]|uniref:HAD-IIIC family phosphatase n=1 Tax=Modestobacter sp. VKM Ac-2985 TaxID=3004139 RepID=UPI0022AB868A|nr:HAD-IIIC family phosphatase [Modestobacter sp. VKM Ac-2985]MCZ2836540.1 HAD-IIIC family phosphatase [Modestobacter sp. VKM Ac-2985]